MKGIVESWSLPWHDLQRSLAESYGTGGNLQPKGLNSRNTVRPAGNWLVRARSRATRVNQVRR
jgi:hypothetical protein